MVSTAVHKTTPKIYHPLSEADTPPAVDLDTRDWYIMQHKNTAQF